MESLRTKLLDDQHPDGYWHYPLEGDVTCTADYICWMHFTGEVDKELQERLALYIRSEQKDDRAWTLYPEGEFNITASVRAYFALKLAGDDVDDPHMRKARSLIVAHGGAMKSNAFTRIWLYFFGLVKRTEIPWLPVEMVLLPRWSLFNLDKIAYWSRVVMVPLSVLYCKGAKAVNPTGVHIDEIMTEPFSLKPRGLWEWFFYVGEGLGKRCDWFFKPIRAYATRKGVEWIEKRYQHGLGGILPSILAADMVFWSLGDEHKRHEGVRKHITEKGEGAFAQSCISPTWDAALVAHALWNFDRQMTPELQKVLDWLAGRQLEPGGWPFQFDNPFYPDLDDTAMIGWVMCQADSHRYAENISRASTWIASMQSRNGGFAAFDKNNTHFYLNSIPFADHKCLSDPPTVDVTARCVAFLSLAGRENYAHAISRALRYLKKHQQPNGSWFGRWGCNYIYGTWSVLTALELTGEDPRQVYIRRAVNSLEQMQNSDGGWGETPQSYEPESENQTYPSTSTQTAWALLALHSASCEKPEVIENGLAYLNKHPDVEDTFTATGFPRFFYLKYHGYRKYFPLWAMAKYNTIES
jgi:squalene-hopene/tetraprenyl-beta-curcumene cyclase